MEDKIHNLRLKKARLFSQIEMLAEVSDNMFREFGKVCAEIMLLEKESTRNSKNIIDEY